MLYILRVMGRVFKTWCPRCFKALSTGVRSRIVNILQDGQEWTVTAIVSRFRLSQPTISYHLSELEKTGMVVSRSSGRHVFYKLNSRCPYDDERCFLK